VLLALVVATALGYAAVETGSVRRASAFLTAPHANESKREPPELPVLWAVPEFSLLDQHGERLSKDALRRHVWIANFIFSRCTSVCPTLTAKMRVLQRKLANPDLRFVSFSVDPEHDTPSALRDYAAGWGQKETRWSLLHTESESLQRLSDGMRVVAQPSGNEANPILHTSLFFLVDGAGRVRGLYDSEDERAFEKLLTATRALSADSSSSELSRAASRSGRGLFDAFGCAGCHNDRKVAPPLNGIWNQSVSLADGTSTRVNEAYVRQSLIAPNSQLVAGYLDLMPSYANELSERQLNDLVDYVRSLSSAIPQPSLPASHATPTQAPPAGVSEDPVCGMKVRVTPETPHATRDGRAYYFCSEHCRERFLVGPNPPHVAGH